MGEMQLGADWGSQFNFEKSIFVWTTLLT